jgi:short-subunit dehydrogenase
MVATNNYALITGGTQGIGRYITNLLAGEGYNLIVVGQSRDRLAALCSDIKSRFPVTVHTYETDLSSSDDAFVLYRDIKDQQLEITTIAHSVQDRPAFAEFAQTRMDQQHDTIQKNIMNFVVLTRLFLPEMIARHSGNLISIVEDKHMNINPNAVYKASIAFLESFMSSMTMELTGSGISVSNTRSSMTKNPSAKNKDKSDFRLPDNAMLRSPVRKERDGYESFMRDDK